MMRIALFLPLFCIFFASQAQIQPYDASNWPVYKENPGVTFMANPRVDLVLPSGSVLYWDGMYNFNKQYGLINEQYRASNTVGLEYKAGEHWRLGINLRHQLPYSQGFQILSQKAHIAHRGKIKSLDFIKEISFENITIFSKTTSGTIQSFSEARIGLSGGLGRWFQLGPDHKLYGSLTFRAFMNTLYRINIINYYGVRFIDLTRTRFDLIYPINDQLYLGIWAARETQYFYALFTSGTQGTLPDRKINQVTPVLGVSVNFVLNKAGEDTFLPGLPYRF